MRKFDLYFDLDGTLIDSAQSILDCFHGTLAKNGMSSVVPLSAKLIGPPLRETLVKISGSTDSELIDCMSVDFKSIYDEAGYKQTVAFEGVSNMLNKIQMRGHRMHLATNKRLVPTRKIITFLNWTDYFTSVFCTDSVTPAYASKSELLADAIIQNNSQPSNTIYIGDRADDKQAAYNNGLQFIAALWGYKDEAFMQGEVQLCADKPGAVDYILNDLEVND
jgi:phosphoglycolate phosphatase